GVRRDRTRGIRQSRAAALRRGTIALRQILGQLVEQARERLDVAEQARFRGLPISVGIEAIPRDPVASVSRQLTEERALSATVAVAKRVQRVDLPQVMGEAPDER